MIIIIGMNHFYDYRMYLLLELAIFMIEWIRCINKA